MSQTTYNINLDIQYQHGELIDVPAIVESTTEPWFNQTLSAVNDSLLRLGILEGEFHWHKHDTEDELFFVLSGELHIDIENAETIVLGPQQGVTISRGVVHRPRAPEKTVVLMVENNTIKPTGD